MGTFVSRALIASSLEAHESLRHALLEWLEEAQRAGIDAESIRALVTKTLREALDRRVA